MDNTFCSERYLDYLAKDPKEIMGAKELLCYLRKENKRIFLATNGVANVQNRRLQETGMESFFENVYISEQLGYEKPDSKFFRYIFEDAKILPQETIMVGDSLSSDILGGKNFGIDTIWFNPFRKMNTTDAVPTYEIKDLLEISHVI